MGRCCQSRGALSNNTWQGQFPHENLAEDGYDGTSPVDAFPANGYGLFDMVGNVWEWTSSPYDAAPEQPPQSCCHPNAGDDRSTRRVVKGGSHLCAPNYLRYRPSARQGETVDSSTCHIGPLRRAQTAGQLAGPAASSNEPSHIPDRSHANVQPRRHQSQLKTRHPSCSPARGPLCPGSLAGVITALALIPEVISFSFVSGVDPKVALVASIVLCLVMSVLGGRPAMVTAAAGSIALVIGPMVKLHGVGYILPTIILAGIIQIAFGLAGLARLTRFIPRSVMIGFVNALGILIFAAQVPHIFNVPWLVYPLFALDDRDRPRDAAHHDVVPAPLVAIIVVTSIVIWGT